MSRVVYFFPSVLPATSASSKQVVRTVNSLCMNEEVATLACYKRKDIRQDDIKGFYGVEHTSFTIIDDQKISAKKNILFLIKLRNKKGCVVITRSPFYAFLYACLKGEVLYDIHETPSSVASVIV